MPEIKVKHVVSCSSEDTTHKAENLLKADTYRKWKSNKPGEKQVSVILQLEKEEQIHSLDVGNEGSAFVEVLVGHSTSSTTDQDYEVILVTSSFMSPTESKNGSNLNRVRMFGPDKLVKGTAEKKWDRVKIVCTQPYNKTLAYGLCFIRLHSPPDPDEAPSVKVTKLGQFKVKEEDSSSLQPGALFFSRASKPSTTPPKASQSNQPSPTYAAATLQAGVAGEPHSPANAEKTNVKPPPSAVSSKELTPGKRKFELKENQGNAPAKKTEPKDPARPKTSPGPPATKKIKAESPASHPTPSAASAQPRKAPAPEKTSVKKEKPPTEFRQLLQGTVFVLSGFQNPFRSDLRDKALEMGAKYRPDWTVDCTHLICAFANTPKYSQVKAMGGIIVRKDWILDCYKRKQCLPCKGYLMNGGESSSSDDDSEGEVLPAPKAPPPRQKTDPSNSNHKAKVPSPAQAKPHRSPELKEEEDEQHPSTSMAKPGRPEDDYGASTDEDMEEDEDHGGEDSGGDTEDELRRIAEEKRVKLGSSAKNAEDPYAASTDENTDVEDDEDLPIPDLPDFFIGKHFFLYGDFPSTERRMLYRFITAFNGELEDYMNEKVNYVITAQEWDDTFEEALNENCNLSFVKPRWIYTCNERQKLIPHQPYVVVPQA